MLPHKILISSSRGPIKNLILLLMFCLIGFNIGTGLCYVFFVFCLVVLFCMLLFGRIKIPFKYFEDYMPICFLLVWMYGVVLGLIRGNNTSYVVANFAGMCCYTLYYVISSFKLHFKALESLILYGGLSVCMISIIRIICFFLGIDLSYMSTVMGEGISLSSTGQLRVYFVGMAVEYVLLGMAWFYFLYKHQRCDVFLINGRWSAFVFFILSSLSLIVLAASKGFLLGAIVIIGFIPIFCSSSRLVRAKLPISSVWLILLCLGIVLFLVFSGYVNIIISMFDKKDVSNEARYDQLYFLLKDCSLMGKGLGATVPGSIRSEEAPYGFELTYINMIHKFGVFSIICFYMWGYMLYKSIKMMISKNHKKMGVFVFSSLGYLFPSIGNPLLMHPGLVFLNCVAIYTLRCSRVNNKIA